jgi:hypothetical protein
MHAPVHVGVLALVVVRDPVQDALRSLRARCVVKVDKRISVDILVQDGELGAHRLNVQRGLVYRAGRQWIQRL